MFRRRQLKWQSSAGRRSLFRTKGRGSGAIHLPASTLKRTPVIRPKPRTMRVAATPSAHSPRRVGARRRRGIALALTNALLACGIAFFWPAAMGTVEHSRNQIWGIDKGVVKESVGRHVLNNEYPPSLMLPTLPGKPARVSYHIDSALQGAVVAQLEKYRPDYGMVVALDAETGKILAMADIRRDGEDHDNLALSASYPAASVFKTVTAAAAIDLGEVKASTVLPYNGKSTTLYKKNVLSHRNNKWTRHDTLEESFSRSVNTVFARLGVFTVGGDRLKDYSERFQFNQPFDTDIPLQVSTIEMDPNEEWSIAETASGYTRGTNISPVHGALLAATIVNDGMMPAPQLVDVITDEYGIILFEPQPVEAHPVIKPETAREMRKLMRETVRSGSARKPFRGFNKRFENVEVGGKTGSLTGFHPKGKYDWFVGYATDGERKIAYAALCINKEYWYVKSSYLARQLIESYFSETG
ncbi:MAG: penicillin-binding protein [Proteobacteria bacterium]|nr:MAG: penicillin-binding protein [Pseudomonadota bacterium]